MLNERSLGRWSPECPNVIRDIDAVNYLDEVLTSPEAPQAAGNDEPIPVPSHQPTYNGSSIKEEYIHILYL